MNAISVMLTVWGVLVAAFVGLMVYRGHLTQHETDQLFLSEDSFSPAHQENDDVVRRVNLIQPFCQGFGGAAALMTVLIVGTYVFSNLAYMKL